VCVCVCVRERERETQFQELLKDGNLLIKESHMHEEKNEITLKITQLKKRNTRNRTVNEKS